MNSRIFEKRRALLRAGLGACATLVTGCGERKPAGRAAHGIYYFSGETMGTVYHAKFAVSRADESLFAAARGAVHAALDAVDRKMSTYRPDSELSRLNRHASDAPFALSAETLSVFATARQVSEASGGAFDVTAGPLVNAWGFGPDKHHRVVPRGELAQLRRSVGYRALEIDYAGRRITKADPRLYADLSGIAKGFGVDRAAQALEALGIGNYMIEAGGEVRARGTNDERRPWQIGIEQPEAWPRRPRYVVPLTDLAMATSGDYRIYFEQDGRRYSHEIDPSTGNPITHRLTSVTVTAPQCALADALATALIVLGPERGYALAERLGLGAYFIMRDPDGKLHDRQTPVFAALNGWPQGR
ncbi:MAG TPA: FAD:protein FMN transferase [Burkholderiales bacterium]|nr:FAD:protein FMN transferase [Burkholderiales bacterium]